MADNPVGQWNTFYIKMVGEHVTIKLNDKLVVDNVVLENFWERDKPIYPSGQIELQNHGNTLYFRNIYVRELSASGETAKSRIEQYQSEGRVPGEKVGPGRKAGIGA